MEGGTLLDCILRRDHLTEQEASLIIRDIAKGLNFLHKKGVHCAALLKQRDWYLWNVGPFLYFVKAYEIIAYVEIYNMHTTTHMCNYVSYIKFMLISISVS